MFKMTIVNVRAVSSMVEHFVYTEGVRGSNPLPPNVFFNLGQIKTLV